MESSFTAMAAAAATTFTVLVFLRAAWHKVADFGTFSGYVADYRLLPEALVELAAKALAVVEFLAVALLVYPATVRAGAVLSVALLALYGLAMAVNIARGRTRIECGCGGAAQRLSQALLLRNALLAAIALLPAVFGGSPLGLAEAAVAVTAGLVAWFVYNVIEQLLANDGHMRLSL
ncbi:MULTISPECIES: MauE/DoxX family redox-associated membrane protein [Alphaproteobacteria]|uniref:Methylamine utilization protein MauE n=2 Tax=Alphaproteobacteria TaxID=28211 RepID=A0A512HFH1_9HYPH|nr:MULTISPECIES: MauE/DoxX family redox-associated membrane protein [Alphaproteobacteria]GEO84120.1 hypothetical protein RNA01_10520 [Ciceribacter naphthalenivorans]GLR24656.1 hypothetical protein GCM10007920_44500 [Ciceribacter naphthalenivorans]GLT07512.1 hypothetical protein GCM10007926_44500 [Sphingomonas psychrolutea]